jgi:arginase
MWTVIRIVKKTPLGQLSRQLSTNHNYGIIGVPFDKGQRKSGVGLAPAYIRNAGLIEQLKEISQAHNIKDYGDIKYTAVEPNGRAAENMEKLNHVAACNETLSKTVTQVINDNRICLTLGGDHAIGIGSIDGHLKSKNNNVAVLWIDAHADLNTNASSPSGNVHGMPVALLLKELEDLWPYIGADMDWQKPVMSVRDIAYIGLRSVDPFERLTIDKYNIHAYGMREVEMYGIKEVVNRALHEIDPNKDKSLHVSFDIDSLDSLEAPSTGTAVRGGLTLREGIYIVEQAFNTGRLTAVDLVEVNPAIGSQDDVKRTVDAAIELLKAACGHSRRGNLPDPTEYK